jgi:hypothetical protein
MFCAPLLIVEKARSTDYSYQEPASIPQGADLTPVLPQHVTNGQSLLGTKRASKLRRRDNFKTYGFGSSYNSGTSDVQAGKDEYPITGVTRHYSFEVTHENVCSLHLMSKTNTYYSRQISPDGVERPSVLINKAFPGPTIEANYGDWIEVKVTNKLHKEGTTIHWHGMLQQKTPWMDGVPSIQQCPIAPNMTFTYRFRADQVGTTWWYVTKPHVVTSRTP